MKLIYLLIFLLPFFSSAQTAKYFVSFTDKNNSPYSVFNPSAFLSQRAIERRQHHGIEIQENDLPVNNDYVDSVLSKGAVVFTRSKWFNGITIAADSVTRAAVLSLPFVQQVTKVNRIRSTMEQELETKNEFKMPLERSGNLTAVENMNYGQSLNQIHIMNGDYLHRAGYEGENMVIALLDAGFYQANSLPAFDSLQFNNRVLGTWDFVANEPGVYEDNDHGMAVLSAIAGNIPGQLVGTAPEAGFFLLRTEDVTTEHRIEEYNWNAGAEFADSAGADIISTSLGYMSGFTDPLENHTYSEMDGHTTTAARAANIAFSKGMLVLASAGNAGNSSWQYIVSPGDGDSVLAVGAVDGSGNYASFSSKGPASDGDVKPNVAAVGLGTTISYSNGFIGGGSGTSFSCPLVSGSAACLWQAFPAKSNREIFNAIQQSASQHVHPDSLLGYGIPDFRMAYLLLGGVEKSIFDDLVSVYPSPFKEDVEVTFYSASHQGIKLEVYDLLGKKVFQKYANVGEAVNNTIILPLSALQSAIYFVKVTTASHSFLKKVMKY